MKLKFETYLDYFIFFIIFIKIIFIFSAIGHLIFSHSSNVNAKQIDPKLLYWKDRTEFIFTMSMAILLIYHFSPISKTPIEKETEILFLLFGIILIFTAKWSIFFHEALWYKQIVSK